MMTYQSCCVTQFHFWMFQGLLLQLLLLLVTLIGMDRYDYDSYTLELNRWNKIYSSSNSLKNYLTTVMINDTFFNLQQTVRR